MDVFISAKESGGYVVNLLSGTDIDGYIRHESAEDESATVALGKLLAKIRDRGSDAQGENEGGERQWLGEVRNCVKEKNVEHNEGEKDS
jgi:hypothetical protein